MKRTLPTLDVDLLIERKGHQLQLTGSGTRFVAKFPTLSALLHFDSLMGFLFGSSGGASKSRGKSEHERAIAELPAT